jgi:tRNA (uracil-5-)-methyltransferase TRM9
MASGGYGTPRPMNDATARALNALNLALYRDRADEWDAVRERPWSGFERATLRLRELQRDPLRVLDVGCGNGRLAQALAEAFPTLAYVGIDASAPLLERARSRNPRGATFRLADFVERAPDAALPRGPFDAVVIFGVLHAVPGASRRRALLAAAASRLAAGGLLALTRWRFAESEERRRRIVPWESFDAIDPAELEPGDHVLRFGTRGGLRYCHATGSDELASLLAGLPLSPLEDWYDDGHERRENHYVLLRRDG